MGEPSRLSDDRIREYIMNDESDLESDSDSDILDDDIDAQWVDEDTDLSVNVDNEADLPQTESNFGPQPQNLFEWHSGRAFSNRQLDFDETEAGMDVDCGLTENSTESDFFKALFHRDLVHHIVEESNRYAEQVINSTALKPFSKLHKWANTSIGEIYAFLATVLLMAHVAKNKIADYWSTDPLLLTPIFGQMFSQDRFLLLMRMLHFTNNQNQRRGDKLFKIDVVLQTLKKGFSDIFRPFQKLCIDESVVQWKGRLSFKQFLPKKRHRFGVKTFVLCDCKTGFVLDMVVYTGKNTQIDVVQNLGISGSVVTSLLDSYLDSGHILYVDNWYSSPYLFQYLWEKGTGAVGTVRADRKQMPKFPKMKKYEYKTMKSPNLMVEKWVDKRDILMISSVHENRLLDSGKRNRENNEIIKKPASVLDYNKNMGLVDKADMQISFNTSSRKTTKWYKKLFFHLLDVTVLNACILFSLKTGKKTSLGDFRLKVISQLLQEFAPGRVGSSPGRRPIGPIPVRLSARHFPDYIPATENKPKPRRACNVCRWTTQKPQKRRETPFWCPDCNVPLCVPECFRDFHTKTNF